ncbi:phosphatidylinositol phosphatase PTPRQ-like [Odontesthes bonariensis]|uniref:phosphatidylinositol phosphatase PTPRQ-like n=1 Tax=Odontesthes bonariensis TaxID=219752 RepID=UPI003F584EDC
MWYPPTEPNGIIEHYTIYYSDNNTVTAQRVPVSDLPLTPHALPDSPFVYTLAQLIGGNDYTLWMTSSTIQGDGGVQSKTLTLLLPEDAAPLSAKHRTSRAPCLSRTAEPSRGSLPWAQTPHTPGPL